MVVASAKLLLLACGWRTTLAVRESHQFSLRLTASTHNSSDCADINQASKGRLKAIHGIGKNLANTLVEGRCYRSLEDVEDKLENDDYRHLKALVEATPPVLCVPPGSYTACSGEPEDDDASEPSDEPPSECLDLNDASRKDLVRVNGIGKNTAKIITTLRCYESMDDFKHKILSIERVGPTYWGNLQKLIDANPNLFCVPKGSYSMCLGGDEDDEEESTYDMNGGGVVTRPAEEQVVHAHELDAVTGKLAHCDTLNKLPPRRPVLAGPTHAKVQKKMRFALFKITGRPKFTFVPFSARRMAKCVEQFPQRNGNKFMSGSDVATFRHSIPVCVLVVNASREEEVVEYVEYNTKRNIPNFVAYRAVGLESKYRSSDCRVSWTPVCPHKRKGTKMSKLESQCADLVDSPFGPEEVQPFACPMNDRACTAKVDTRGHMAPVNDFSYSKPKCSGTMHYLNVFPSRNDPKKNAFDGYSWAAREHLIPDYLIQKSKQRGKVESALVLMGVSKESDGAIPSRRKDDETGATLQHIEVPSFAWKAMYDPIANKATSWVCRNGLSDTDDCYCVDAVSIRELEARVGHPIFPQLEGLPGLNLEDGTHDEFYGALEEKYQPALPHEQDFWDGINDMLDSD